MGLRQRLFDNRSRFCHAVVLVVWGVLGLRLLHIQFFSNDVFASHAHRQQISEQTIVARPGDLLDREGRLLATTLRVPSLFINPSRIENAKSLANQLAEILSIDASSLQREFEKRRDKKFYWVKRHLSDTEYRRLQELDFRSEVVGFRDEFKRFYPQGQLAAHVIGLRNIDGEGRGGVEQSFDETLRGTDGTRRFVRDARGKTLELLEEVTLEPVHGTTIVLTLDAVIQLYTEQALNDLCKEHSPVGASAIVLDPQNGEVLAMASRPTFDLNRIGTASSNAWRNNAIASIYEPGSTFKPFVVAWGLQHGMFKANETIHCEWGEYRMGQRILHDHHSYGELSLTDVLVKSSNIGMAKLGERIGNTELYRMATTLGFGRRSGVELPGEVNGLLRPLENWNSYSTGSIPMGHEIAVTPIQMISAHAILANRGRRISPHLIKQFVETNQRPQDVVVADLIAPEVAEWVVAKPMQKVVERGTGTRARIDGVSIFGKTGTAQKVNPNGGYFDDKNVCSFVCGAPAEKPRLLVLVCVDEPTGTSQSGGTVAAPYAARILKESLAQLN